MPSDSNRNLLFGILALQMDFISREQLVAATSTWLLKKTRPIEEILQEQQALREEDQQLLAPLVARHIENHDADVEKSLAALSSISSLREDLQALNDPRLAATLSVVGRDHEDALATLPPGSQQHVPFDVRTSGGSRFRVLRPHAKGGLGKVSVAEDIELAREVAFKEIQTRFADDPNSRARFVLEAEVTGGLEHPGIVPVYGLGQYENGRPYYAMRFIRGDSLQEAVEQFHNTTADDSERTLELRKLLGRFVDVCNAIEYAHSRGVLHRDLKPGNIMLGKYGETLVVDWGLAKAAGRDDVSRVEDETTLTPRSRYEATQMGSALGTPAYMPPEQAAGNLDELGPASDVYSLGATLYHVLTGQKPIAGKSLDEILTKVQTGDFPAPRAIKHDIPKPLEAICLRAMALRPQERYASPQQLADDIERFLADESVSAHTESLSVRARRWMRKHPTSVAALAATVLVGLTSTAVIATVVSAKNEQLAEANQELDVSNRQLGRVDADLQKSNTAERQAKEEAVASQEESEAVLSFFQDKVLAAARPKGQKGGLGIDATIREAVDAAEPLVAKSFADQPLVEASIRSTLGMTYLYLGEAPLAVLQHQRARALRKSELGPEHPAVLMSMSYLAGAYQNAGRLEEAISLHKETLTLRKAKLGLEHPGTLVSMGNLAAAYYSAGRLKEALPLYEGTLKLQKATLGSEHPHTLTAMNNLAMAYQNTGRLKEALALHEETLKLVKSKLGPEHPDTLVSMSNLAAAYYNAGRLKEALPLLEEVLKLQKATLGSEHPDTLTAMNNLAMAYKNAKRLKEAIPLYDETLKLQKAKLGPKHPATLNSMNNLAAAYQRAGQLEEAIPLHEEALKLRKAKLGPEHPATLNSMNNLATAYWMAGRLEEALPLLEETLKLQKATLGLKHPGTLMSMSNLAFAYQRAGRLEEAILRYEKTLKLRTATLGLEHPDTITSMEYLTQAYLENEQPKKAISLFTQYIAGQRQRAKENDPRFASTLADVSDLLLQNQQHAAAETYLRECLAIREKTIAEHWLTFDTKSQLGGAVLGRAKALLPTDKEAARKKFTEAAALLAEGFEGMKARESKIPAAAKVRVVEALERLVDLYTAWENPDAAAEWQTQLDAAKPAAGKQSQE